MQHRTPPDYIDRLIAGYTPGKGLPAVFYQNPGVYARDLERVVRRQWHCLGHVSVVPEPGDFEVFALVGEKVILSRAGDGSLHAMLNVCRHKGAEVCADVRGNARGFVCRYHAWTYGMDGALKTARLMPAEFDAGAHGLHKLHLRVEQGLVFVTFAREPLDFSAAAEMLRETCGVYGWAEARVAHRQMYSFAANWKVAIENYVECYHCGPAHPEYSQVHVLERPMAEIAAMNAAMVARTCAMGLHVAEGSPWETSDTGREAIRSFRYALHDGMRSASDDGGPVGPLMGDFTAYDGGVTSLHFGGLSYMVCYPDHGVIYRFLPTGVDSCEMELIWLVKGCAVEGVDYDLGRLTWLWDVTSVQDKAIIESTARGMRSAFFVPGPVAPMEAQSQRWIDWYLAEVARD